MGKTYAPAGDIIKVARSLGHNLTWEELCNMAGEDVIFGHFTLRNGHTRAAEISSEEELIAWIDKGRANGYFAMSDETYIKTFGEQPHAKRVSMSPQHVDEMLDMLGHEPEDEHPTGVAGMVVGSRDMTPAERRMVQKRNEKIIGVSREMSRLDIGYVALFNLGKAECDNDNAGFLMSAASDINNDRDPSTLYIVLKAVEMIMNGHPLTEELFKVVIAYTEWEERQ